MKKLLIAIILSVFLLSTFAEAKLVDISGTRDSKMRPYQETAIGGVPSAGHYTYWAVSVKSTDRPKWVTIGFQFDNKLEKVKVYVTPEHSTYVYANGYMKTYTNKVKVTLEPPYN